MDIIIIFCFFLSAVYRKCTCVQCFQSAKIEIEGVAVVGNIVDQDWSYTSLLLTQLEAEEMKTSSFK